MRAVLCLPRRQSILAALATGAVAMGHGRAQARATTAEDPWPSLAGQIFNNRPLGDGSAVLAIEAPYRAEDAAVVPITIHAVPGADGAARLRGVTLVIDENPSPLAARFALGASSGITSLSTRIRVDSYTKVHAVAEMDDGRLLVAERFIKAAGGCSAPAAKQVAGDIPPGSMRLRRFPGEAGAAGSEIQLMIRHPNYSGMQMDQLTRLYVPAHFVASVQIWQGEDLLLGIESGISISENPEFRFNYHPSGATEFRAEIKDNEGMSFRQSWTVPPA